MAATAPNAPTAPKYELKLGKATRDAFGEALREEGKRNDRLVVIDGDVSNSTRTEWFGQDHPERFFNVGIAESNMAGVAAGMAASGKVPVVASFATFLLCNAYDQLRMSVAFPALNVKMVGSHAGISIGEDGPSQMAIEDVALACALPGVVVLVPSDEHSTRAAVRAMVAHDGPVYLRVGRPKAPLAYSDEADARFEIGKARQLRDGSDLTIIANGLLVGAALQAHDTLAERGISARVLDMATAKPLDEDAVAAAARETGGILVAEEHLSHGGLGSIVAMAAARLAPCNMRFVNLGDRFAESGTGEELMKKYGLTATEVVRAAEDLARGR
ncbi:MAG: Transketolase, C-terminal section [uncultured Chloroflexi bacterium]|uniref:Transketolase, C-terminal section n=1 Tax=uncultured Chloroflexota bacterium TaxID=166587 RepID=A0A6J4JCK2_9CHLR|nr:MAG: Transketolase, C-terminal section [uncultured Chloroflexota bacterium]